MLLKMRDMDYRLNLAYSNIIDMISFGESIVKTFKPAEFSFMPKIDSIVEYMIRQSKSSQGKPSDYDCRHRRRRASGNGIDTNTYSKG